MRCFIAIEFDETTKAFLSKLQDSLRGNGVRGNFTHPSNFHLTMKFLGEIDHRIVSRLDPVLSKVASGIKPFVLRLDKLGKFSRGNRSIIWCGLEHNSSLYALQRGLVGELAAEFPEFSDQSDFSPHITLVREAALDNNKQPLPLHARDDGNIRASDINFTGFFNKTGKPDREFTAEGLSLMESVREDGRLKYVRKSFHRFA